jgi:shikimate dehydrogenase
MGAGELKRDINTETVLYGVFGDPVAQSKSPLMLNCAFAAAGLNAVYTAFHVLPERLKDAVEGIRALHLRGVNVTIPHKVKVMDYLDDIDEAARSIGAVNTIVNENGRLVGYNTDGIGYVRSLKEETGVNLKGQRILVIGAGGAARGIVYALAREGAAEIVIANRTQEKAVELAAWTATFTEAAGIGLPGISAVIGRMDILINTTQIGMYPKVTEHPLEPELLRPGILVSDIIYNPRITLLLQEAGKRGARIHGGLGMFVHQGAFAFEYWTGLPAPVKVMREALEQALGS